MNYYIVGIVVGVAAAILLSIIVTCGLRLCYHYKPPLSDDEQTTQHVLYPEGVQNREVYEPHYTTNLHNRVEAEGGGQAGRDPLRDRYYFNFQDLEAHPFQRRRVEAQQPGPIMAVDAQGTQLYAGDPYVGALVFDEDVARPRNRQRGREPIHYGEAVYVAREDTCAFPQKT